MKKLQPEKGYKILIKKYTKSNSINRNNKLIPETSIKIKMGQNLSKNKFEKIIKNLSLRNTEKDRETINR